ncbi:asparagine synthase (glutamine-hydrolyzing) [Catalinimonas alkaloidigena]|uniref:asparagine synthase (glutamine-hydrolyzing) n=1 Tax=Catalinimonas alkaloidigena TaxID=1075417 RepID=UPI0024076366|nr:asparagine synthase (glutamine-hydrolyzing) [Catalinimonas alkaloidigena]MDF9796217.1 asparagine synthase (glutamine-hydrolyzing) [Catalinimonas alkaloidigena]
MCGITGIYAFNEIGRFHMINLAAATDKLSKRGPDFGRSTSVHRVGLGHRRLSIIDTSAHGNQPMKDSSERFTIIFNGEIYNYRELRKELEQKGVNFQSATDTEVLLQLYIHEGKACLGRLNGFFAFAIYDEQRDNLFIARDRFGIKPLLYYADEDKVLFASEMKSLLAYGIEKELDTNALYQYLQFNYTPAPATMLKGVQKLLPGHYLEISKANEPRVRGGKYYEVPFNETLLNPEKLSYEQQQNRLHALMEDSVKNRLIADVPLGAFLSGGIDSSVITALASRHVDKLNTFSIGYRDEPFYDETKYAQLVADKYQTNHTVFSLSNYDLYGHLFDILDHIDEPFADSSAIPVYILSKETKKKVTVALSGDGADEVFSGYNKHHAAWRAMQAGTGEKMVSGLAHLWKSLPKSRNNPLTNKVRQLARFSEGMQLSPKERYIKWATYLNGEEAVALLSSSVLEHLAFEKHDRQIGALTQAINDQHETINQWLYTDVNLVLPNDMLTKVDLMSMAHGLEIRVPFLDHKVVEFVFTLPEESKINRQMKKRILQDTFRKLLPPELYKRPKQGFEVPLLGWFRTELKSTIEELLSDDFIAEQDIFDLAGIQAIKQKLFSNNPGDVHATIWALIVFQHWWKQYMA